MLTGYAVSTIAELLSIPSTNLPDKFKMSVASENCWYQFRTAATRGLTPNDNPVTGRWMPDIEALNKVLVDYSGNILVGYDGCILYNF